MNFKQVSVYIRWPRYALNRRHGEGGLLLEVVFFYVDEFDSIHSVFAS